MIAIQLITVGTLKTGPIQELAHEYLKRLKVFAKIEIVSIRESSFRSPKDAPRVQKEESGRIQDRWNTDSFKIILSEHGKTMDSKTFAQSLDSWTDSGQRHLTFVIAGPLGVSNQLLDSANHILSLSPMTFTHEMAQALLLEQLYRANTILSKKIYHY